ncbi:MAG TPA: hypothetical protein VI968_01775 [archaeon]|nr:hypothetical protein [archaeon]
MPSYTFTQMINSLPEWKIRQSFATMQKCAGDPAILEDSCLRDSDLAGFAAGVKLDDVDYGHVADCRLCTATSMYYDALGAGTKHERKDITNPVYTDLRKHYKKEIIGTHNS